MNSNAYINSSLLVKMNCIYIYKHAHAEKTRALRNETPKLIYLAKYSH